MKKKTDRKKRDRNWLPGNWEHICLIVSTIVAIVSVSLAVYYHNKSFKKRELTYYISPTRSIILRQGQSSELRVLHRNEEIQSDISVAQISIWNNGKEAIWQNNVIEDIQIKTNPPVQILEVKARKINRQAINFSYNSDYLIEGYLSLNWKVLEKDDGAFLELIYAGPPDVEIFVEGDIEGQDVVQKYVEEDASSFAVFARGLIVISMTFLVMIGISKTKFVSRIKLEKIKPPFLSGLLSCLAFLLVIGGFFGFIYIFAQVSKFIIPFKAAPFGF